MRRILPGWYGDVYHGEHTTMVGRVVGIPAYYQGGYGGYTSLPTMPGYASLGIPWSTSVHPHRAGQWCTLARRVEKRPWALVRRIPWVRGLCAS